MRGRRRGLRWALAPACVVLVAALLLGTGTRADSALLANCTDSQLVPRVAQLLVSQGAPGYTRLARGKEAVVRAYLTNPTTCTVRSQQSITPVSATLDVSYSNGASGTAAQLSNNDPLAGKLTAATAAYSTADPYFVVPASHLAPANGDPPPKFDITFTLGLTYRRTGSTASFTTVTGSTTVTATVDQRTNALRILVVPMGDRSSGSLQWSEGAATTFDNVMANAGRALPVSSGVTKELASTLTTAGIRYRVSGDLLDVKALGLYKTSGSASKFCANAATWATTQVTSGAFAGKTLKTELQDRLDNYNLYNSPPADLVLGVIDGAIAWKSADGITGGCDDGRAATPNPTAKTPGELAWVRVDTGTYPTPLQMELAHTLGIVDPAVRPTLHGLEVQTDVSAPDRVYNVLQRKVVMTGTASGVLGANDHSIMNYDTTSIPYTKDNTLALARDWDDALCDLGGTESNAVGLTPAFASCTISTPIGTDAGVAAGVELDMFHIDGHLSGGDVTVNDANTAGGDGEFGIGSAGSPLHLLLCEGSCGTALNTRDVPLSLSGQAPIDEDHVGGPTGPTTPDTFSALIKLQSPIVPTVTFTCAELKLDGVTTFDSCASDPAPDIDSTTVNPGTVVESFPMPVESGNGRAIAFDGTYLYTTLSTGTTVYKQTIDGASAGSFDVGTTLGALAWNAGIGRLYGGSYTGDGKVYEINPADGAKEEKFTFSPPDDPGCLFLEGFIDGLEYRPTAGNLALSGDACDTVFIKTLTGDDVSSFPTDNNSGITTDGADGLWLARLTRGDVPYTTFTHVNATTGAVLGKELILPDYLAEDIAYDAATFAPTCVLWTNEATFDAGPPEIRAVAVPCAGGSVTGTDTVGVQTTNADFVTLFAVCGTQTQATDPNVEKFSLGTYVPNEDGQTITPFTDDRFCANATVIAEASNGWTSTGLTDVEGSADVTPPSQSPTVNIAAPFNGAKFRIGDSIHYEGYPTDAEDGASAALVTSLKWYDNGNLIAQGAGKTSFDLQVPSTASLGTHEIKLEATDADGHTSSTSVTIQIRPRVCSSSSGCP